MKFEPYAYQERAIRKIENETSAGLFLDMGLGKTVITLTAIKDLIEDFAVWRVLVTAPPRVAADTWTREFRKWDHLQGLRVSTVIGTPKQRAAALEKDADVYIISRDCLAWLVDYYQQKRNGWPFDMLVIDELSGFKNSQTKRFRAIRKTLPCTKRVVGLTGTPSPNGLIDLWAQIYLLDRGERLGRTLGFYREKYFRPGKRNGFVVYQWEPVRGAQEAIEDKLRDLCLSMSAEDYLQLPDFRTVIYPVKLSEKVLRKYRKMERELLIDVDGQTVDAVNAAALTTKLLQISSGAIYDENGDVAVLHEDKLDALDEIVESASGENVIVFYAYRHELERLKKRYPEAVDVKDKDAISRWKKGEISMLLAHPASAGHGLNLQSGGHISIWYGLTTNLEYYQQANKRLHRQGQTRPVVNYVLLSRGTYDETVYHKIIMSKEQEQESVIAALRARIKEVQDEWRMGL